jgi:hypothetical protein
VQFLQDRGFVGGWCWRSDLAGIYDGAAQDLGPPWMSWTEIMRGLSQITRKRRRDCQGWLPNGEWGSYTEMQYFIPRPKKKKAPEGA